MKEILVTSLATIMGITFSLSSIHASPTNEEGNLSHNATAQEVESYVEQTVSTMEETETETERIVTFTEPNGDTTKVITDIETNEVTFESDALSEEEIRDLEENINTKSHTGEFEPGMTTMTPDGIPNSYPFRGTFESRIEVGDTYTVAAVTGAVTAKLGGNIVVGALAGIATKVVQDSIPVIYTAEHVYQSGMSSYQHVFFFSSPVKNIDTQLNDDGLIYYYSTPIVA